MTQWLQTKDVSYYWMGQIRPVFITFYGFFYFISICFIQIYLTINKNTHIPTVKTCCSLCYSHVDLLYSFPFSSFCMCLCVCVCVCVCVCAAVRPQWSMWSWDSFLGHADRQEAKRRQQIVLRPRDLHTDHCEGKHTLTLATYYM